MHRNLPTARQPARPQPTTAAAKARSRSPRLTKKTGTQFLRRKKRRRKSDNSRGGKGGKQCVARIEHSSRHARAWRGHPHLRFSFREPDLLPNDRCAALADSEFNRAYFAATLFSIRH